MGIDRGLTGGTFYFKKYVKPSMIEEPRLGVCVVFKEDKYKMWFSHQLVLDDFSQYRLAKIISSEKYSDFEKEFVIIDKHGNVLYSNSNTKVVVDGNGFVHIDNDAYLIKVVDDDKNPRYIGGKDANEINKKVNSLVRDKTIKRPKDFIDSRFINPPLSQSEPGV
ncbi:MAG: hypothetical protein IJB98_01990 [Clostridia bacterium]|nr:hypothetical protein [Clostridia bacterium]